MSLLTTDITKVKKLSLKGVNLPPPERRVEPIQVERPFTDEEITFNNITLNNNDFKLIAERLDLKVVRVEKTKKESKGIIKRDEISQSWSNEIKDLEAYFNSIELPTESIKLDRASTIKDCKLFINSHFTTVRVNNGNNTFLPYLNRLQELKKILEKTSFKVI